MKQIRRFRNRENMWWSLTFSLVSEKKPQRSDSGRIISTSPIRARWVTEANIYDKFEAIKPFPPKHFEVIYVGMVGNPCEFHDSEKEQISQKYNPESYTNGHYWSMGPQIYGQIG